MFYSHEILASTQYGVATIWMIATTGKSAQRKITKRAIKDVNVPKACKSITHPEAPLALRLQGNLLYGVSRVFEQQTGYVLLDAERIQVAMLAHFRTMKENNLDPQGGKTNRKNITLQDDPNFDPSTQLPGLDLLTSLGTWDGPAWGVLDSQKSASQLTPLGSQNSSNGRGNININLPDSSNGSINFRVDLGPNSPASWKPGYLAEFDAATAKKAQEEDHGQGFLDFDIFGNLLDDDNDGPVLPSLTNNEDQGAQPLQQQLLEDGTQLQVAKERMPLGVAIPDEQLLPDAAAFPSRKKTTQNARHDSSSTQSSERSATARAQAAKIKQRARQKKIDSMIDTSAQLSRKDMKDWQVNYVERMKGLCKQTKGTSASQARKNAPAFLYLGGVAKVGALATPGVDNYAHPLVEAFAGKFFKAAILGREVQGNELSTSTPGHKSSRRAHLEAFAEN